MKTLWRMAGGLLLACSAQAWAFDSADFGSVPVGSSKLLHHVVNSKQAAVPLWPQMVLSGPDAAQFQIVNDGCSGQRYLQTCTLDVMFWPSSTGVKSAFVANPWSGLPPDPNDPEWALAGTAIAAGTGGPSSFDPFAGIAMPLPFAVQNVVASGNVNSLTLTAVMNVDPSIAGLWGHIFLGAHVPPYANGSGLTSGGMFLPTAVPWPQPQPDNWYLRNNGSIWRKYEGGAFTAEFRGVLAQWASVDVLAGAQTPSLCGTEFYVGYGHTQEEMLANNTYGKFYTMMCNVDFKPYSSGPLSEFSLAAYVQVATVDVGQPGSIYLGRLKNGHWMFHDGIGWKDYSNGPIPAYEVSGNLYSRMIQIYDRQNAAFLDGAQLWIGYGLNEADMVQKAKYGRIYP